MPVFQPRNRVQIVRDMVARTIARSPLSKLRRNAVVFHILAAAADEDAEQYFQMTRLREVFSIDEATGSDLDERAAEIQPGTIKRRVALFSSTTVKFTRNTSIGALPIPSGSQVAATDARGQIFYRTTAPVTIIGGSTESPPVTVVAAEAGARGNVAAGQINSLITKIPTVIGVTNDSDIANGRSRESDDSFRRRLKDFVAALSGGTDRAVVSAARNVVLVNGQRVLFANYVEPVVPTGVTELFIDDGTGAVETFDDTTFAFPAVDTLIASAVGGERVAITNKRPIRSLTLFLNGVPLVFGVDWLINSAAGIIEFLKGPFPTGLTVGDLVEASYVFYTGLVQETQRVITGDPANPLAYPGIEAGGIITLVKPAQPAPQTLLANATVIEDFDVAATTASVSTAIQEYINNLDIGESVIVSEIIERAMAVPGMFDFNILELTGSTTPANQNVLPNQVARIGAPDITIT